MQISGDQLIKPLILVAVVGAVGAGLWLSQKSRHRGVSDQISVLQAQVGEDQQRAKTLQSLTEQVEQIRIEAHRFTTSVPDSTVGLFEQLSADLSAQPVLDKEVQAKQVVHGVDFSRVPLVLEFKGTFQDILNFLERIESYDRIVRVDRIDVSSQKHGEPLSVRLELSAFCNTTQEKPS